MNTFYNRRDWFRKSFGLTAGLTYGASLVNTLMASPVSEIEKAFFYTSQTSKIKIRLGSNENPYGPSEKAKQAIIANISEGNRYPFGALTELKEQIAKQERVSSDHISVGAGSGDLLCAAGVAFGLEGGSLLSAFPTFPMLMNYGEVFRARWDKVNLNENLEHDYQAIASRLKDDTKLVFICNPNNPTGTLVDPVKVKSFCREISKKVTVYVDEAYLEFLDPAEQVSMVDLVRQGENVVISRTFSKIYGLAGLRIGYVVAKPDLIRRISRYQMGIPVNQLAVAAAKVSLSDNYFMELSRTKNNEARKVLTDYLDSKKYFYGKSHTNFVFFDPQFNAQQIMTKLADYGIGIRVWDYNGKQWCRVSIGTVEEMKVFVNTFESIVL